VSSARHPWCLGPCRRHKLATAPRSCCHAAPRNPRLKRAPRHPLPNATPRLAPPLRSPAKPRSSGGAGPAAAFAGPGAGRGGRGGRGPGRGGGRGGGGSGSAGPSLPPFPGGLLGPGLDPETALPGGRGSGGGAGGKRPLLAQHQTHYAGAHGHYLAGQGRSLLAAQFMSEALRQQLQQQTYLAQSQVGGWGGGGLVGRRGCLLIAPWGEASWRAAPGCSVQRRVLALLMLPRGPCAPNPHPLHTFPPAVDADRG
jgi:hypothetical protein